MHVCFLTAAHCRATMQLVSGTSDSSDLPVEHALEKRGEVSLMILMLIFTDVDVY